MKKIYVGLFVLLCASAGAQNLVPNADFEQDTACPTALDQLYKATGWISYGQSPDYYNSCSPPNKVGVPTNVAGYQPAHSGNAYAGFIAYGTGVDYNYREYSGATLPDTLTRGATYYLSFYVSWACHGGNKIACNKMGALFSTVPYTEISSAPLVNFAHVYTNTIITDTVNWTQISGSFVADSAYRYIIIGNFFDNAHTDTAFRDAPPTLDAYYYLDDVCLSKDAATCGLEVVANYLSGGNYLDVYPNPAKGSLNIQVGDADKANTVRIFDSLSKAVYERNDFAGKISINTSSFVNGIYYVVVNTDSHVRTKTVIVSNH